MPLFRSGIVQLVKTIQGGSSLGNTSLSAGTNLTFSTATSLTINFPNGVITDTHTP